MTEYALLLAGIALAAFAGYRGLGTTANSAVNSASSLLAGNSGTGPGTGTGGGAGTGGGTVGTGGGGNTGSGGGDSHHHGHDGDHQVHF